MWFKEGDSKRERESETTSDSIDGTWKFNWFWFWTNSLKFLPVSRDSLLFFSFLSSAPIVCPAVSSVNSGEFKQNQASAMQISHAPKPPLTLQSAKTSTRRQTKWNQQTKMLIKSERDISLSLFRSPSSVLRFLICVSVCQCVAMNVNFINEVPEWQVTHTIKHTHTHTRTLVHSK